MERTIDVTALGELLIDFTESGLSPQGNPLLEANPGGAPCNLLAMLARLGHRTAFLGKVGRDTFGDMLRQRVSGVGVDVSGLRVDEEIPTTLAFVHTQPGGERDFSFYRKPGADLMLREDEVDFGKIAVSKIFHFGTLSSTGEPTRSATRAALKYAKAHGCLISFDPNLRPPLWDSLDRARAEIDFGLSQCDVLKISDNELAFMTGETDIDAGVNKLLRRRPIPLVLATALGQREKLSLFGTDYPTRDGTCVRDYIHVEDLIDAHLLALEYLKAGQPSAAFNLGNGQGFTNREIIEAARRVTGCDIPVSEEGRRPGDPATLIASSEKAMQVLHWQPRHASIEDIIGSAWRWHSSHPHGYSKP